MAFADGEGSLVLTLKEVTEESAETRIYSWTVTVEDEIGLHDGVIPEFFRPVIQEFVEHLAAKARELGFRDTDLVL